MSLTSHLYLPNYHLYTNYITLLLLRPYLNMKRVLRRLSNEFIDLTAKKPAQSQPNYRSRTLYTPSVATEQSNSPLPLYSYKHPSSYTTNGMRSPALAYTQSVQEANELIQALRGHVGFDMEWKVDFRKSAKQRRTAIVQVGFIYLVMTS